MGFFDEVDEPLADPPRSLDAFDWAGPPNDWMPATVALDVVLARTDEIVVWVADALVFPSGLSFGLTAQRQRGQTGRELALYGPSAAEDLRFGVALADGRRVIAATGGWPRRAHPDRPILRPRSGGGGGLRQRADLWLWPLPPPGRLDFVLAWPSEGIAETRASVDAGPIVAAAARAEALGPGDQAAEG